MKIRSNLFLEVNYFDILARLYECTGSAIAVILASSSTLPKRLTFLDKFLSHGRFAYTLSVNQPQLYKMGQGNDIRKKSPCSEYPLKPHFYIVKWGYAGAYRSGSNMYPQSMF